MRSRTLVAAVLSIASVACSDALDVQQEDATGSYALETLNGLAVPVPLGAFYGYTLEYTSSDLSLSADNSYHERSIVTERVDGGIVQVDTVDAFGLWRQNRERVVLRDVQASDSLVATLKSGKLTFDVAVQDSSYHYVYRRK